MKAGIVNVTGYAGVELARFLLRHPQVELTQVTGRGAVGQPLVEVFPHLAPTDLLIQPEISQPVKVAFVALPHKASAEVVPSLLESGAKVIDISADFRLKEVAVYERWYEVKHPCPQLLAETVYGLPELHKEAIQRARLVANPGCYPTGAILALAPVMDMVEPDIIIDAKSGVSGAGRTLSLTTHYSEVNENCQAYGLGGHRHLPEMEQELSLLYARYHPDRSLSISFIPHLIPMTRGILSTCYARLTKCLTTAELRERYCEFYRHQPFVQVTEKPPQTKETWGSNLCLLYPLLEPRTGRLIVISCLDNLVKGAAGQAIQNMNLMFGLEETASLEALPIYP